MEKEILLRKWRCGLATAWGKQKENIHFGAQIDVLSGSRNSVREFQATGVIENHFGEEVQIALNYNYLIDPIKSISSDELTFEFTEPLKAITLRPEPAEDYFHIIMPMQMA